jgi:hypothetical protein
MVSFLSPDHQENVGEQKWKGLLSLLGRYVSTPKLGSNKAVDYAVVDIFFYNYICLLSGALSFSLSLILSLSVCLSLNLLHSFKVSR